MRYPSYLCGSIRKCSAPFNSESKLFTIVKDTAEKNPRADIFSPTQRIYLVDYILRHVEFRLLSDIQLRPSNFINRLESGVEKKNNSAKSSDEEAGRADGETADKLERLFASSYHLNSVRHVKTSESREDKRLKRKKKKEKVVGMDQLLHDGEAITHSHSQR